MIPRIIKAKSIGKNNRGLKRNQICLISFEIKYLDQNYQDIYYKIIGKNIFIGKI